MPGQGGGEVGGRYQGTKGTKTGSRILLGIYSLLNMPTLTPINTNGNFACTSRVEYIVEHLATLIYIYECSYTFISSANLKTCKSEFKFIH